MPKNKSGQTAFGAAAIRLIEQYQPESMRLFTDPVLQYFFGGPIVFMFKFGFMRNWMIKLSNQQVGGIYGSLVCRTRYIDEKTQQAVANGIRQVLILGAGLDTRPYRLSGMNSVQFIEADMPSVQEFKKEKVKKHFGSLPLNVVYVPIDFNNQSLREALKNHSFDFSKPTLVIWEGVTQYITGEAVDKTLEFVSTLPADSYLVFTYILEEVIDKKSTIKGAKELMEFFEKRNSPWQFGLNPSGINSWLEKYGLQLVEDAGAEFYTEHYLKPIHRTLSVAPIERIVFAVRK